MLASVYPIQKNEKRLVYEGSAGGIMLKRQHSVAYPKKEEGKKINVQLFFRLLRIHNVTIGEN
jgi:hypothetical protein